MKHTKGTWEPCKYGTRPNLKNAVVVWHEDHHTPIAKCVGDKSQANANLIANAPEMLKMLKQMVGELDDTWMLNADVGKIGGKTKYDVKRLIAKAEGGE